MIFKDLFQERDLPHFMTVIHIYHLSNFLFDLQSTYKVKWLETKMFKKWYLQNKEIKTTKLGRSKTQTFMSQNVEGPNKNINVTNGGSSKPMA